MAEARKTRPVSWIRSALFREQAQSVCLAALTIAADGGKTVLAFSTYYKGRYRMFRMDLGEPVQVVKPGEQSQEPPEIEPFATACCCASS